MKAVQNWPSDKHPPALHNLSHSSVSYQPQLEGTLATTWLKLPPHHRQKHLNPGNCKANLHGFLLNLGTDPEGHSLPVVGIFKFGRTDCTGRSQRHRHIGKKPGLWGNGRLQWHLKWWKIKWKKKDANDADANANQQESCPIRSVIVCLLRQRQVPLKWIHAAWTMWDVTQLGVALDPNNNSSKCWYESFLTFDCFPKTSQHSNYQQLSLGCGLANLAHLSRIKSNYVAATPSRFGFCGHWSQVGKCQQEKTTTVWRAQEHTASILQSTHRGDVLNKFSMESQYHDVQDRETHYYRLFFRIHWRQWYQLIWHIVKIHGHQKLASCYFPPQARRAFQLLFAVWKVLPGRLANRFDWHILDALRCWRILWCWCLSFHILTSFRGGAVKNTGFPFLPKVSTKNLDPAFRIHLRSNLKHQHSFYI